MKISEITATPLHATAEVALAMPGVVVDALCTSYAEYATITRATHTARIESAHGTALFEIADGSLAIRAEAADETSLSYMKMAIADALMARPDEPSVRVRWSDSVPGGSPPPFLRAMEVVSARMITPHMRRLTLRGERMERFAHGGLHIRLLLPRTPDIRPVWPILGEDGRLTWPENGERPIGRVYTIRNIDVARGLIDIDFVLHPGGDTPGATFGETAKPGDIVGMTGPGGGDIVEADWYLLAGDETALPAIARILEKLPADKRVTALIEVADASERQPIASKAALDLRWLHRDGLDAGTTSLLADAVRDVAFPTGDERVHVFAGCEFAAFKTIRSYLRTERRLTRTEHLVAAYWRLGIQGDDARRG